ncbi:MAG: phosphatase PAP2 family protein [Planctomycetota bacterium]
MLSILSLCSKNRYFGQYFYLTFVLAIFYCVKELKIFKTSDFIRVLLRTLDFIGFLIQYQLMGIFTVYFTGFCDSKLVEFEEKIFGIQPLIIFDRITNRVLTEFFMLCYFLYVPLLPLIFLYLELKNIKNAQEYVLRLAVTYSVTFLFFFIFPISCPKHFLKLEILKPLKGLLVGDMIISGWWRFDIKGGCFPSPHCAAGFTIVYFLYKNKLKLFYPVSVIMTGMFISTVYGRFHYLSDSIAGIILSFFVNIILSQVLVQSRENNG